MSFRAALGFFPIGAIIYGAPAPWNILIAVAAIVTIAFWLYLSLAQALHMLSGPEG